MSLRRFLLFTSNASINTSTRATLPPSYISTWVTSARIASPGSSEANSSLPDVIDIRRTSADITKPADPRYIYYRIYAEDGAIPLKNPTYSDDPYLGRILAKQVTPPHTAMTLKRCLLRVENIDDTTPTSLFNATSSQIPMNDGVRLSLLAHPGLGSTPNEPIALVCTFNTDGSSVDAEDGTSSDGVKPEAVLLPSKEGPTPFELRYLYYRVYKAYGAVLSKQPADPNEPSVGRVSVDFIPPPHTAASIMRCISKIEEITYSGQSQLFIDISSESPIGEGHVSIFTSDYPGSTPDYPMAFVTSPATQYPSPEPRRLSRRNHIETQQGGRPPAWAIPNTPSSSVSVAIVKMTKREEKLKKVEEKERKRAEAKAKTERLALELKEKARQRAAKVDKESGDKTPQWTDGPAMYGGLQVESL